MNQIFLITLGLIRTNTLSPNNNYYYRIKEPYSLNPSAFGCKAAFFSLPNRVLKYYNSKAVLHELHSKEEIDTGYQKMLKKKEFDVKHSEYLLNFVWWSLQGNMCYFLEYKVGKKFEPIIESIFLHLNAECCYRINEIENNFCIVDCLKLKDREYDEEKVVNTLKELDLLPQPLIKDKLPHEWFINKLLNFNKWYP